jgi:3-methyladenine DNA glycosylase/8-oxoguanine DNA glycosylase
VPSEPVHCHEVSVLLADVAEGAISLEHRYRAHVDHCLRCQAELIQYRKLLRALRALRRQVIEPEPGLLPDILAAIEEAGERRARRELLDGRRAAYLGGLAAAATAAGVGGALVIANRSRRRLRLAG